MSNAPSAEEYFPLLYDELRRLAAAKLSDEPVGHTLDATALVHEAYIRLGGRGSFEGRSEFFKAAAIAMRRILIDHARRKRAAKRGGRARRLPIDEADGVLAADPDTVLDVEEALNRLAREDRTSAEVARSRLFAGLTIDEVAEALRLSRATALREWTYARSWLIAALVAKEPDEAR